jgi:UDP-3-O-[3-hydroxymyristoyl] glucosamine N-acyltransferase
MKLDRTAAEIAALVGGSVEGPADRRLSALESLERAGPSDLVAVFRDGVLDRAAQSRAGALLVTARLIDGRPAAPATRTALASKTVIRVASAEDALDLLVTACAPKERGPAPGVHPTAIVEPGAEIGPDAAVGPHVFIGAGARIGARTELWPGVFVGERAHVGSDCRLHPHVVIASRCRLGDRVVIHAAAVIGEEGFGYRQDAQGRHIAIPQVGTVELGDDVRIGAQTTVDRARFETTRVGRGTKIDDHVHVGHNVQIGEDCAIAGHVALAGSVVIGARVMIGGGTCINNGVRVGDDARIGGLSGVVSDLPARGVYVGFPARERRQWAAEMRALRKAGERIRDRGGDADSGGEAPGGDQEPAP